MRHAGERERRTSFSDVLRSHRAGTARSPKGHCGDEGQPVRSQTTLRAREGSSGECAILSARVETQLVSGFSIAIGSLLFENLRLVNHIMPLSFPMDGL